MLCSFMAPGNAGMSSLKRRQVSSRCHGRAFLYAAVSTLHIDTVRYAGLPRGQANEIPITTMDAPDNILIVDDDAEIRTLLSAYFGRNGLQAAAVGDGKAMWRALSGGH